MATDLSHLLLPGAGALTAHESMLASNTTTDRTPATYSSPGSPSEGVDAADISDPGPGAVAPHDTTRLIAADGSRGSRPRGLLDEHADRPAIEMGGWTTL